MTGNPYPQSAAEQAALAPTVYQYVNNIGRQGGIRGPEGTQRSAVGRLVNAAGKTALAAGAIAGAVALSRTPEGKQIIENVAQTVQPHLQNVRSSVSAALGSGEGGSLYERVRPGVGEFLGGFKEGVTRRFRPEPAQEETIVPSNAGVIVDPEQTIEASRPITYGKGSRPVDTSRVTWGRGDIGTTSPAGPITGPWQERPSGVVVVDLSQIQEQGAGGLPYEIQENIQSGPGLEAQLETIDYANKAAAYRKSQQYAEMAARHPALQNIGANEELVGGATGATRVLPTQEPVKTTDLYDQRNIPEPIRTGQLVSGANPESPLKDLLGPGEITQPAELVTEQPMRPSASVAVGPSPQEISELDAAFAKALGHLAPEQRAALRDAELDKKYRSQSGVRQLPAEAGPSAPVVVAAINPVAKANRWRQARARAERSEDARVGRLDSYGYDPYELVEKTSVMQEAPGSRQALLAEQLQRDAMRQAEMQGHYANIARARQAVPSTPYNPQEFRSFMKPASTWMGG